LLSGIQKTKSDDANVKLSSALSTALQVKIGVEMSRVTAFLFESATVHPPSAVALHQLWTHESGFEGTFVVCLLPYELLVS
jgi:hypothetical protein